MSERIQVQMPDGTVIDAPSNVTRSQLMARYSKYQAAQPSAEPTAEPTAEPSLMDQGKQFASDLGRAAVTTTRDYAQGALGLAALPVDAIYGVWNKATGRNDPDASQSIDYYLNKAGIPQTENPYIRGINRALGGAATSISVGNALAQAGDTTSAVGNALQSGRSQQLAGSVGGATASQATADLGGGPVAQTAAGLVGGIAAGGGLRSGVAENVKRSFRGGEAGRQRLADNVQLFDDAAGITPSVGQGTQNRRMQATESLLAKAPGGAGRMASTAENTSQAIGRGVERAAATLSPRSSAEQAGRAINEGVEGFHQYLRQMDNQLYGAVDAVIPPSTPVQIPATQRYLQQATASVPGAPNTSALLSNNRLAAIAEALGDDLQAATNGSLPYQSIRALRTRVGESIQNNALINDVPTQQLRRLYGSLSDDLHAAAKQAGPDAERAAMRANTFHRAGMRRLEVLESVVERNGGPEKVFKAATSGTAEGATTLRAVMQSLPQDGQKMLTATVLRRLGRANNGVQNELGERFSTETFLTNWNKLSSEAKRALFDRHGAQFRTDMDRVAQVADNLRQGSQVFRNPSGTAQAGALQATLGGAGVAVATGNLGTAAAILATLGGANASARLLTHPPFVRWLASQTARHAGAYPAALNQLAQSKDPIMQEAYQVLAEQQQQNATN